MGFFDNLETSNLKNLNEEVKKDVTKIEDIEIVVEEQSVKEKQEIQTTPIIKNSGVQEFNALKDSSTEETINALKNREVINLFENDEEVKNKITESAKQHIKDNIDINKQDTKNKKAKKRFEGNKEACKIYGVADTVPLWQQALMTAGSAIWFVIYFIFATLTIAPISTFALKLDTIFKKMWVSIIISVIIYIALTLPIFMLIF